MLTVFLEEVSRKQAEMSTRPLAGLQDAGRHATCLSRIFMCCFQFDLLDLFMFIQTAKTTRQP